MNQRYPITIQGHLTPDWAAVFDGMQVICLPDGNTLITGNMPDQAALYGLLMRLRDLDLTLISIDSSIFGTASQSYKAFFKRKEM
jgi:hypothetical protein